LNKKFKKLEDRGPARSYVAPPVDYGTLIIKVEFIYLK